MSNDANIFERLYKQQATIGKMVLDGARDPYAVAAVLQSIIDTPKVESEKFALLADLGYIEVPAGYEFDTALALFRKVNKKKCYYFDVSIIDKNFNNPSRVLKAGDRLYVRAFQQVISGTTTSDERMNFLSAQPGNVFVGAQGMALAFEQKRDQLPKGKWYASFDEKEHLPFLAGYHGVPGVDAREVGDFKVGLGNFGGVWHQSPAFFCFSDESLVA